MNNRTAERQVYYLTHREKENIASKAYYQNHRQEILERARKWRLEHPEEVRRKNASPQRRLVQVEKRHLDKVAVMLHYSNPTGSVVCNGCGEQDIDILCIDHIAGGGKKHYKELGNNGIGLYNWLVKEGFPNGFQVLCANCNMRKGRYERSTNC